MAVNALKDKARRALYAIKKKIKNIEIPLTIWCKIFDSVIQPIARFGVHSVIRATRDGTDIQQKPYTQNSAK